MSSAQKQALEDGVNRDEYLAGFDRFSSCVEAEGYEVKVTGEHNEAIQYLIPASAVDSGKSDECYVREFQQIDIGWQLAHEDTSDDTQRLRDCLADRGIEPEYSTEDVIKQFEDAGIEFADCK